MAPKKKTWAELRAELLAPLEKAAGLKPSGPSDSSDRHPKPPPKRTITVVVPRSSVPRSTPRDDPYGLAFGPPRPAAGYATHRRPVTHDTHAPSLGARAAQAGKVVQHLVPHFEVGSSGMIKLKPGDVVERPTAAAQAAPVLAAGAAAEAAKLVYGRGQDYTKGFSNIGAAARGQPVAQQQAGVLPTQDVQALGEGVLHVGAAGAGAAYGFRHPVTQFKRTGSELFDMLIGLGLSGAAISDPSLSPSARARRGAQMVTKTLQHYSDVYGPDVTLGEAFGYGEKHPLSAGMDNFALVSAALGITGVSAGVLRGLTIKEAMRAMRDPAKGRYLTYTERGPKLPDGTRAPSVKTQVKTHQASSPATRLLISKPYDATSWVLDKMPGARRLPIAESRRAARAVNKNLKRSKDRRGALANAYLREVHDFLNEGVAAKVPGARGKNEHYATTIAALVMKPNGFTDNEWEQAIIANYKSMLADPDNLQLPGHKPSPAEQRLINRVASYDRKAEADRVRKRGLTVTRLHDEQKRLSENLDLLNGQRQEAYQAYRDAEHNPDLMDKAREDEMARHEGLIAALETEAQVMRKELAEISADQPEIDTPARRRFERTLEQIPYFKANQRAIDDALAVGDAAARNWGSVRREDPAGWWERRETVLARPDEIPLEASAQTRPTSEPIPFSLKRAISPERAAENLRYVEGGDFYKRELGKQRNKKAYRTVGGTRVQVFGRITPEEWVKRVRVLVPDAAERDKLARWYSEAGPTLQRFFGKDTEQILRGFAVSQANASPAGGLTAVMRVLDKTRRGEEVPADEISTVVKSIEKAVEGEHVSSGLAAKLHDFADSLEGKSTRTWMGDDPRGGWPVANDVHAIRDLGYIDGKLLKRLGQPESTAMFKRGFKKDEFVKDSGGSPSDHQYERMREHYEEITRHLNDTNFDGRNDWTPSEVQALGWSSIQRLHGATPEDLGYAVLANTRRVNLEVTKGISGIGKDLTLDEASAVANAVEPVIQKIVRETPGLWSDGKIDTMISAYEGAPNASLHFSVLGSPEATHALVTRLTEAFDQYDVWATRESSSTGAKPTLVLWAPELADSEKALALYQELFKGNKKRFAGFAQIEQDGVPGISLVMPGKAVTVASHDARYLELESSINEAIANSLGDTVNVKSRLANTQIIKKEWKSNVPSEQRRVEGARSEGAVHDPLAAEARGALERAVQAVRDDRARDDAEGLDPEPPPEAAPRVHNQSRRSDTLGATQLINSETGQRIIWLTENADFSTVMHELIGHAVDEFQDLYPQEFAKVEQVMGKPLRDWETADHEKFATWFERYLSEGHAPTPELVDTFNRAKQYMRVIYEQIRRALGGRIPPATRDLFEHYLGGWDSEASSRIATNMGRFAPSDSRWAGARSAAQQELTTLQKRNSTRRFNKSIDGMVHDLNQMWKEAEANKNIDNQAEREARAAEITRLQAEMILRSDKRVQSLQSKVSDMEKALSRDPSNRRFSGAVQAAKWLMDDRERILKEVFGPEQFEEIFGNRRDLLANYLVQHGVLQSDFEHGSGSYFPIKLDEGFIASLKLPMQPASNRVIGQLSKASLGVHHRNEMIRWQAGDWSADPTVLQLAHSRATAYQFALEVRELIHSMGRPLTAEEQYGRFPDGVFLINKDGTPLSPTMKRQTKGMTNTTDAEMIEDGLFGDEDKLTASLENFFNNSVIDPSKHLPEGFSFADQGLRVVDQAAIKAIFRPVRLNVPNAITGTWDWATTAARFSMIYANAPGYMITNGLGNLVLLTGQQGLSWIPRAVGYSKMLANDAKFRQRLQGEFGHLPAKAAVIRGRGFSQVAPQILRRGEESWLNMLSVVDEYPRYIAWMAEANKKGYWGKESMIRLLDGKTEKTRHDREYVAERTNQHMIDFTYRISDRERDTLGRLFFIWPYVRGATALPFWYAKNYPARTAFVGQMALQQRAYQEHVLGQLPPGREDLFPISRDGDYARVMPTRFFNPAGPLPDEVKLTTDLIASAFGRPPDNLSARLSSLLNPNLETSISLFTGRDQYGRDESLAQQAKKPYGIFDSLVPFERLVRGIYDEQMTPRAFRDKEGDDKWSRAVRQFVRIEPQTVTVPWLGVAAQSRGAKTTDEKIASAVAANMKHFHEVEGAKAHYSNALRKQVAAKVIYEDRVHQLELDEGGKRGFLPTLSDDGVTWDPHYHADAYDKAVVAYEIMKQNFPEVLAEMKLQPPNDFLTQEQLPPRSEQGLLVSKVYTDIFNTALTNPPGPKGIEFATSYDAQAKTLRFSKHIAGEQKRGVYRGYDARQQRLRAERAARSG